MLQDTIGDHQKFSDHNCLAVFELFNERQTDKFQL